MRFEFSHTHIYPGATASLSGVLPSNDTCEELGAVQGP